MRRGRVHAADTGAEGHAGAFGVDFFLRDSASGPENPASSPCFACGDEGELARGIQALCFYLGEAAIRGRALRAGLQCTGRSYS